MEDLDGAMGDKLRDIALLYAAYDGKLHAEGVDARSRLQKLQDRLAEATISGERTCIWMGSPI